MNLSGRTLTIAASLAAFAVAVAPANAEKKYGPGVTDAEIKIGNINPYSGPASAYGAIGRAIGAYFDKVNDEGGVNGRKIKYVSLDDGYSPPKAMEQARRLVEQDQVLLIFQSLGTPSNTAIQKYMNEKKVPQLFVATGATKWDDPKHFPWTMGWQPSYQAEGRIYAKYILNNVKDAKIAVLYQNDDYGKDYLQGLRDGLGAQAGKLIVAEKSYETSDPTVDSQIIALKASGADTLVLATTPKFTAQAIRKTFDIDWHPTRFIAQLSASVTGVLEPAGPERSKGVMAVSILKSASDPQWRDDPEYQVWAAFMRKYYPKGDLADQLTIAGYSYAVLFAEVLRRCGDNLTRENLMKVATHLEGVRLPMLLPGITLNTSPNDYNPIKQWRLQRFDGHKWELLDGLIEK